MDTLQRTTDSPCAAPAADAATGTGNGASSGMTPIPTAAAGPFVPRGVVHPGPPVPHVSHQKPVRRLRVAAGLGDAEREQELLGALSAPELADAWTTERCLTADQVLERLGRGQADVLLLAGDLHRLSERHLDAIAGAGVPLVLLAGDGERHRWHASLPPSTVLLALDAPADEVLAALAALLGVDPAAEAATAIARTGGDIEFGETERVERVERAGRGTLDPAGAGVSATTDRLETAAVPTAATEEASESGQVTRAAWSAPCAPLAPLDLLTVLTVAGGPGSPGRTTVAVSLAAALGAAAPTVLVDLDFDAPAVCQHLNLDPTRNVYMVAHAEPATPREWERALVEEAQPLSHRAPHGVVLCGVPKAEMRAGVSADFVGRLLEELRQRYRYVVLDTGAECFGPHAVVHRSALAAADHVLLVAAADVVGLSQAQTALARLRGPLGIDRSRTALVINRHDRRYHYDRRQIEWALETATAAIIPFDHAGVERALAAQRPLVLDARSRAGRALLDLAERTYGGHVVLPPEATSGRRLRWPGWRTWTPTAWPTAWSTARLRDLSPPARSPRRHTPASMPPVAPVAPVGTAAPSATGSASAGHESKEGSAHDRVAA